MRGPVATLCCGWRTGRSGCAVKLRHLVSGQVAAHGRSNWRTAPTLLVTGAYTWSWGFEVTHPAPQQEALHGVNVKGPGTKLVNLVVDDATDDGIFIWPEATGAEVNGSIV